jgi:hypothetical protein
MARRRTISRREPVITLGPLKYRGRRYKEGDHLDRRRVRMPHSKLVRLILGGVCILAKDLDTNKLNEYGYVYDTSLRYRLTAYKGKKNDEKKVPETMVPEVKTIPVLETTPDTGVKVITELKKLTESITAVKVDGEQIGFIEMINNSSLVNVKIGGDIISKTPMKIDDAVKLLVGKHIKKGE